MTTLESKVDSAVESELTPHLDDCRQFGTPLEDAEVTVQLSPHAAAECREMDPSYDPLLGGWIRRYHWRATVKGLDGDVLTVDVATKYHAEDGR